MEAVLLPQLLFCHSFIVLIVLHHLYLKFCFPSDQTRVFFLFGQGPKSEFKLFFTKERLYHEDLCFVTFLNI